MKKHLKKVLKIFLWILVSILGLFLLLVIALQIPFVQQFTKEKAITYLEGKIKTKVSIERIKIGLPKKIILEGVYFEDQQKDTLLAGKKLAVDISLFKLLNNKVEINSVQLEGIVANIDRNLQSEFNFDYILKAFTSAEKIDDTSAPMEFSIDKINFDKIKIKYKDAISNNDLKINLNHFETRVKTFDLEKMEFDAPKLKVDGLQLSFKQGITIKKTISKTNKSTTPDLKLKLETIDLSKISVVYEDDISQLNSAISLEKLLVEVNSIDLKNNSLEIKKLNLSNSNSNLNFGKVIKKKTEEIISEISKSNNWKLKLKEVTLDKVNFNFNDANAISVQKGIDYNHLSVQKLKLNAKNIDYNSQTISGTINAFEGEDKSGLKIESLKTTFFYGPKSAYLKNLYLKTPKTIIRNEINIGYPSISSLSKNPENIYVKANIVESKLSFTDVLLIAPTLSDVKPFKDYPNAILDLNTIISGKLNNLSIPKLQVSGIGITKIDASGKITGLPDSKKAYFDLKINKLQSSANDVNDFVPDNTIPNSIQLPSQFTTKGTFKGTIDNFNTILTLSSSYGNAKIKAAFNQQIKNKEKYNLDASLNNFDLGKLIKNDSVGKITLNTTIKGVGLNQKTASAIVKATVLKANFNSYTYQNLILNGKIINGVFNANATIKDPNLKFDMITSGSFKGKYPAGKIRLNVDIADLEKLNLHAGALKIRGVLDADIQSADLDYLNGTLSVNNLTIANEKDQFVTDSINIIAISTAEKNSIVLKSQFMNADIEGKYRLSTIANSLEKSFSNYYNLKSGSKNIVTDKQQLTFAINVKSSPVLFKLIPELESLEPISISGKYNSINDSIVVNGSIPKLIYSSNTISNAVLKIDTVDKELIYSLVIDDVQNAQFQLPYTNISGKVANDIVDYTLQLKNLQNKERYLISGNLKSKNGGNEISLDPKNLILNYESWVISNKNLIRFGDYGIYANNFELNKGTNSIKIQSQSEAKNAPMQVDFSDFEIKTITDVVQLKNFEANGTINGNAVLKNLTTKPLFTADLKIDDFTFKKDTVGTIRMRVNNETLNTYTANVEITDQDNQVNLNGNYKVSDSSLDMNLDIQKLNLKSIQGFSMDNISESTGFLTGKFKISGQSNQPLIIGNLQFNDVGFKVMQLNAKFKSINDKIAFTNNGILFDNFIINDEKNNQLSINGKIRNEDISNLGFDLKVDAENFYAVNSKEKDNELYYGELYLDNHLSIKGDINKPIVEGSIKINKGTKMTIVLPQSDPSIADREGIVEFIDQDNPKLIETVSIDESLSKSDIKGIDASVNIEIDKEAELSMIIDKTNGDYLKLKGEASLNGGIDPSGKTTLTGRYEFTEGTYEMNFNLIKRKFDIKKGSYILWTGEPTTADINITAIYKSNTAPIDLVDDQLGSVSPEVRNTYKQKIPFETELKMKGELLKPEISFNILLPEGNNNVSTDIINTTKTKLIQLRQQPNELNKQVFALLLLNRFIGENPFASEAGVGSASSLARASASKILSQQLNNLAGDLIKGVELDFDLQSSEDYTTGQKENKTELNVGLSKKLLNDRLKVTVGSNFGLEGPQQANQDATNIAGDISADYQLTKDGRYKVRAYRKNQYQVALQGQVIETGVAFIITIDYNKFKELFQKSKEDKAKIKKNKDVKKESDEK